MAIWLKQSTAVTLKIGPFLDDTDGKTAETGLTISQADVRLSMNGGDIAQKNESTACTHDELGIYGCPVDTTDTGTLGRLQLWVHESGALPVWHEFMVVPANVWDSMFGADYLQVDIEQVDGDGTAAANLNSACDNYSATRGLSGTALPAAAADAAGGLPISDAGALDLDAKLANTNEVTAARMGALTDLIDGGRLDLILDAILVDTGTTLQGELDGIQADTEDLQTQIGVAGAGLTAVPWNAAWDAEVQSECTDALNAYDPPTNAEMELRTLPAADYTVVSDLGTVQTGDAFARLGAPTGASVSADIAAVKSETAAIVADTNELQTDDTPGALAAIDAKIDTIDGIVDAIVADTGTDGVVVAAGSKTGYALSNDGVDAIFDRASSATLSFETLILRTYEMVNNKMAVTEANGDVVLRNIGDTGNLATGNVASSSGTTTRAELSWA